jgi:hypothetical protein
VLLPRKPVWPAESVTLTNAPAAEPMLQVPLTVAFVVGEVIVSLKPVHE